MWRETKGRERGYYGVKSKSEEFRTIGEGMKVVFMEDLAKFVLN